MALRAVRIASIAAPRFTASGLQAPSDLHIVAGVAVAFVYYCLLITGGSFALFQPVQREIVSGVVFNSMLSHLLQGDFTVDPEAIRLEAYVRDGRTYTYFGILPALLRLPLLPLKNFATLDVTAFAIAIATCVAAYFKCASLLLIRRLGNENPAQTAIYALLVVWVLFGGPQVQFLKASVYQEVICWAMALTSAFVYCALRGLLLPTRFSPRLLVIMACLAGLALLTRVTAGIGLYGALALLLALLVMRREEQHSVHRLILPLIVLIAFAVVCGAVNYGRWGNPFVFADIHANRLMVGSRIAVIDQYGEFNLHRLPYALIYYFVPIDLLLGEYTPSLFSDFRQRYYDGVELPASSFLISDPATLILAGVFLWSVTRTHRPIGLDLKNAAVVLVGLSLPVLLILTYYFLAFRFRAEFYPVLDLAALLGFHAVSQLSSPLVTWRLQKAISYGVIVGISASHTLLVAYKAVEWS